MKFVAAVRGYLPLLEWCALLTADMGQRRSRRDTKILRWYQR